jgi:hypothetical protein
MRFLRYMTTANVLIGPVIKSTDGYSPLQGMTSDLVDINFWKTATNGALTSWDYDGDNSFATFGNGYINLGLRSSNVCMPGQLRIEINASASGIPTFDDFQVINQHVYDAMFCSSGVERLQTDMWEITATAISTAQAQLSVNVFSVYGITATATPITTGTVYDTMDHGTLMRYMQAYAIGDFGATGISTNVIVYKNYSNTTVGGGAMSHTFTTKTREWSSG